MSDETTEAPKTVDDKLAELRARKAERERKLDDEDKLREIEALELEEKLEKDLGGRAGEKFVVLIAGHRGPVAVKLGLAAEHKAFNSAVDENLKKGVGGKTGLTEETCHRFVKPNVVHPDLKTFNSIIEELPGVLYAVTGKLAALFDADRDKTRGKS